MSDADTDSDCTINNGDIAHVYKDFDLSDIINYQYQVMIL